MKIDLKDKKRILAISDIHGYYDDFIKLLNLVNYNPVEDQLITLGDYADRGRRNVDMFYKMIELKSQGAIVLFGNHDLMALYSIQDLLNGKRTNTTDFHIACDGENTYKEFLRLNTKQLETLFYFLKSLPRYYVSGDYIFLHAGIDPRHSLEENIDDNFLWMKNEFFYNKAYNNKIIVFGHTDTRLISATFNSNFVGQNKIWFDENWNDKIGIDCGRAYNGKLACLELPSMKEYYV